VASWTTELTELLADASEMKPSLKNVAGDELMAF